MRSLHTAIIVMVIIQASKGKSDCGRTAHGRSRRMINANATHRWPWHAAIYHWVDEYECGGTLISPNAILTAAHCVSKNYQPMAPENVSVWLGILHLNVKESSGKHFEVAKITLHPDYNSSGFDNDIAIIRLKTNATFDNDVQPICLWDASKLPEIFGRNGTVIGWGKTENGNISDALRQAVMPVVHHGKCLNSNRPFFGYYLSETNFCAGLRNGASVCNGDSGGSLTFEDKGIFYIRGILSTISAIEDPTTFKRSCDSTQFALFTDVAQYLPWIEEVTEECEITVNCAKSFYTSGKYLVCKIQRVIQIWEQKCKIIFTEITNTEVTGLVIRGGLEVVPDLSDALDKFENLKSLEIPSNNIKVVDGTKLTVFERIERLHLGGNQIAEFEFGTFDKLKNLTVLYLNNNKLTEIDRNLFRELIELKVLWLDDNQLKSLPPDLFWNNKKLEILSVSSNNLQEIDRNLFSELRELRMLSLSKNQLEILQEDLFRNNSKLEKLTVSGNKIKFIHQLLFSEVHNLILLILDGNELEILPEGLFRNNAKLELIWASNNKIKRIESNFQHLANLEQLDLTGNVCIDESWAASSPTEMQEKIWRECKCNVEVQCDEYYKHGGFFVCRIYLNIELTEQKCKIIFAASSNPSVTWLSIRGDFDVLPEISLVKFDNLQVLDASESKLKVVERTKLKAFSGIKKLLLQNNEINELASDTFDDLNLNLLWLDSNKLNEIHEDLFSKLYNLMYLSLSDNQLEILPEGLFRNNAKLELIWASNNKIKRIESNFQHLANLEQLDLTGNVCIDESWAASSPTEMQEKIWRECKCNVEVQCDEYYNDQQEKTDKIGSDLADRIERLKKQIENARELANSIKVGVNFHPNTTLELRPPSNLNQLATTSRVSAFVKTDKPNGFLLYLGNENKSGPRRNKRDDFMALEVENGYPILTIDLGNGPERIISNKHIANGQWHQVIVERTGNDVKLTVHEEIADGKDQLHEVVGTVPGADSVFNVDAENSKLFVGGYPPDYNIQDGLKYSSFEGQIEDLLIGDQEAGLWNFVDGQDNNHGALERDRLMAAEVPATGYRFGGQGYVILDSKPYMFKQRSSVQFKFKVCRDVTEGLIFYAGKHKHFISVEMKRGGIYFQYRLGQHSVTIGSNEMFNDDQWHRVEAEREGRKGILKIDGKVIFQEETPIDTEENLKISDSLYFGGVPHKINQTEITTKNFDGCIDDVYISGSPVDLSKHLKAYGVRPGCPMKFSSGLSFSPGYLRLGNTTASNHFQINMKFKTNSPNGIIFYATNHDQSATIGLALRDGSLVFNSREKELSTGSNKYNTGEWHVVTATHDQKKLRLYIAENEYVSEFDTDPLFIEHGDIYYGGLPHNFITPKNVLGSADNFIGCISDVTIRGQVVNFANSTDKKAADLDNCSRDIFGVEGYVPIENTDNVIEGDEVEKLIPKISTEQDREQERRREEEEEERRREEEERRREEEEERRREDAERKEEERRRQEEEAKRKQQQIDEEERRRNDKFNELEPNIYEDPNTQTTTEAAETTQRTTRRRPIQENKVEPICKLPVEPEVDVDFDAGYRFGTSNDSRIEFTQIPAKIKRSYDISLQFKTNSSDGVLFYAADVRHTDFIALYLQGGKLIHAFNCGSGSATMVSDKEYNNGVWHTVVFSRQQAKGRLLINGEDEQFGESVGSTRNMAVQPPYFIGGVNPDSLEDANVNLKMTKGQYFSGCIRNVQIGGKGLGIPEQTFGVIPCSEQIEEGMFFGKGGGYIKLRDRFKVGTELTISFDIKPRTLNGLLLSVHGKNAYLILQLMNGTINFTVDNGDGPIVAIFKPDANENFCDGNWHSVSAIKSKYVITLMVNRVSSQQSIGNANSASTDTSRPLFMGGHPHLMKARGLSIRKPYLGCIRNVRIRDAAEEFRPAMMVGNVQAGVCPTN